VFGVRCSAPDGCASKLRANDGGQFEAVLSARALLRSPPPRFTRRFAGLLADLPAFTSGSVYVTINKIQQMYVSIIIYLNKYLRYAYKITTYDLSNINKYFRTCAC
jgi:hypothetical protein